MHPGRGREAAPLPSWVCARPRTGPGCGETLRVVRGGGEQCLFPLAHARAQGVAEGPRLPPLWVCTTHTWRPWVLGASPGPCVCSVIPCYSSVRNFQQGDSTEETPTGICATSVLATCGRPRPPSRVPPRGRFSLCSQLPPQAARARASWLRSSCLANSPAHSIFSSCVPSRRTCVCVMRWHSLAHRNVPGTQRPLFPPHCRARAGGGAGGGARGPHPGPPRSSISALPAPALAGRPPLLPQAPASQDGLPVSGGWTDPAGFGSGSSLRPRHTRPRHTRPLERWRWVVMEPAVGSCDLPRDARLACVSAAAAESEGHGRPPVWTLRTQSLPKPGARSPTSARARRAAQGGCPSLCKSR